jgi:NAD(P)H-dependent FMN reductase
MITLISGTSRKGSRTRKLADNYLRMLREQGTDPSLFCLEAYSVWQRDDAFIRAEQELLIPAQKFVFIIPEYNGSIPGILKMLLDNSDIKNCWWGKKAMLTGLADGRAGNLRGLEHMTGLLNYLHMDVYWNKLPISRISTEMTEDGTLLQPATVAAIHDQINGFLHF